MAQDTDEALKRKEAEVEERRKQSHNMVAESIRRELRESASLRRTSSHETLIRFVTRGKGSRGSRC